MRNIGRVLGRNGAAPEANLPDGVDDKPEKRHEEQAERQRKPAIPQGFAMLIEYPRCRRD
ncbi:hypothetical protein GV67_22115 [Pseudorhizobium pelagicum]|uniref:Uncharacterized protein n=1 Tax=Pseudorhizobium pelagicum TaxID=1509405 RepID=A0A922P0Z0_9HYPH|nr:hypothetical protein GV67_22115 [Pseudorhizobium pelagicum]KEQ09054.1 hypothetical protein GV68_25130 [Pseudorhizobium pelagicum]